MSFSRTRYIRNENKNSFVYFTNDQNYVIKTISRQEKGILLNEMLDSYSNRVFDFPESKLVRILGVFKLSFNGIYFILMENTAPGLQNCQIYDLRGARIDRILSNEVGTQTRETLLSNDKVFRRLRKEIIMGLSESSETIKILKGDMKILRSIGVMDYSLLLVMSEEHLPRTRYSIGSHYYIAILDLFQMYDNFKGLERWYKINVKRVEKEQLGTVSPAEYFNKLLAFIKSIFSQEEEIELSFTYK